MLVGAERFSLQAFVAMLLLFFLVSAVLIGLSELSRQWSPTLPAILYPLWFAAMMYVILTYITANDRKIVRFIATGGSEMILAMLLVSMLAATVTFGMVCREIFARVGTGFSGVSDPSALYWVAFGFDNLFEAAFLDAPNVYGLNITTIQASEFWTQTLVLVFRAAANLLIIRAVLRYWGYLRNFLFANRVERPR
jgi:hypothetical protein